MYNNKQRKNFCSSVLQSTVMLACAISTPCFATFDVMSPDTEGYYGNAEVRPFKDVLEGTETLSAQDKAYLESLDQNRLTNRWYFRALIGHPRVKLKKIANKSSPPLDGLTVAEDTQTDNLYQLLLAGGKVWENWALEMELFLSKTLNYSPDPLFGNFPNLFAGSSQTDIKQVTLFFNVQYIIPRWFSFQPQQLQIHLDAGFGPSYKTTNTTVYDAAGNGLQSASAYNITAAGMLGAGLRYQLTSHFLIDLAYRFMDFGKTKFAPIDATVQQIVIESNQMTSTGPFLGFTYQV